MYICSLITYVIENLKSFSYLSSLSISRNEDVVNLYTRMKFVGFHRCQDIKGFINLIPCKIKTSNISNICLPNKGEKLIIKVIPIFGKVQWGLPYVKHQPMRQGQTTTLGTTCPTLFDKCVGPLMSPYRTYDLQSLPKRTWSLTICRCNYKDSMSSSVILRPWVLVWSGACTINLLHSSLVLY